MKLQSFIMGLLVILLIIVIYDWKFSKNELFANDFENNVTRANNVNQQFQSVDYNEQKQQCNQLVHEPSKCSIDVVMPTVKSVCTNPIIPYTPTKNNKESTKSIKSANSIGSTESDRLSTPELNINVDMTNNMINKNENNHDLLSKYDNLQINNIGELNNMDENSTNDIKSLNSLENDLLTNM